MAKSKSANFAVVYGIHPDNFSVDSVKVSDAGTSGSFLHEAEHKTSMIELEEVHSQFLGTQMEKDVIARLKERALKMKEESEKA